MNSMNRQAIGAVVVAITLSAGLAGGYWWARHTGDTEPAGGAPPPPQQRRILYWQDPMVPGTRFDKPGRSPFMNMDLVPVYADAATDAGGVRIDPDVTQDLGVRLGRVERRVLSSRTAAVGNVVLDEGLTTVVSARVDGYVARLHVPAPLTRVHRGAPLADVVAPAWLEAGREYRTLVDSPSPQAAALRDAAHARLAVLGLPADALAELEHGRGPADATTLRAPRDGVVTELDVRTGSAFAAGTVLFRINGLESVWVEAAIPEAAGAPVAVGDAVVARSIAWPGADFRGRVLALLPSVSTDTRTRTVRIAVDNRAGRLAPGMYVTLDFEAPARAAVLTVPTEAVIRTGRRSVVITAVRDGAFAVAAVETGAERDGRTEILRGLREGQTVVLSGQFLIDSEANLRATQDRLGAAPAGDASGRATEMQP